MKILIVGDPVSALKPKTDSSLFIAQEFLRKGHEVFWAEISDLYWCGYHLETQAKKLNPFDGLALPEASAKKRMPFEEMDLCLIRKDPPFNEDYLKLAWLLSPFQTKVRCVNSPAVLAQFHEKMLPYEALTRGFLTEADLIPMVVARHREDVAHFVDQFPAESYVLKPWLGYAGNNVQLFSADELMKRPEIENQNSIVQVFAPEVKTLGDRRVLFFEGRMVGEFVRMPQGGGFVSNVAQGGRAERRDLTKEEQKIIWKIERFLQEIKIDFAGADLIGSRLNEINITSPTGLRAIQELESRNLAEDFVKIFGRSL
jgi:glutathione synthase